MNLIKTQYKKLLEEDPKKTCFILKDNEVIFTSEEKGVKPMIDFYLLNGISLEPLTVVDRIIGKGALMLAKLIGANYVVTPIISEIALEFADEQNVIVEYSKVVPYIINRTKDGQCPIEISVTDIDDIDVGYEMIQKTLLDLKNRNIK